MFLKWHVQIIESEGTDGFRVDCREAPSIFIVRNRRWSIKSLKMVVETSDIKFYFSVYPIWFYFWSSPVPTRPEPTRQWRSLMAYIPDVIIVIGTWNFDPMLFQVLKLSYQYLESISFIFWKLCVFRHRWNFHNFWQFLYHNCQLNEKFLIVMVSSERFNPIRVNPILIWKYICLSIKIHF